MKLKSYHKKFFLVWIILSTIDLITTFIAINFIGGVEEINIIGRYLFQLGYIGYFIMFLFQLVYIGGINFLFIKMKLNKKYFDLLTMIIVILYVLLFISNFRMILS